MRRAEIGGFLPVGKNGFLRSPHAVPCAPDYQENLEITKIAEDTDAITNSGVVHMSQTRETSRAHAQAILTGSRKSTPDSPASALLKTSPAP
jgi:hypothetical protein